MKKAFILFVLSIASITPAFAQLRASTATDLRPRYADNFDMSGGVKLYLPAARTETVLTSDKTATTAVLKFQKTQGIGSSAALLMAKSKSLSGFSTGNSDFDGYILNACDRYNIDPLLIYAQMNQESAFKLKATSHKGASGLMQLMPATARRFGVTSIYDPKQNIEAGVKYMRWLLDKFNGDMQLALAGYNAGEGAVMKYGNQIPPYRETQNYVARITARYNQIRN